MNKTYRLVWNELINAWVAVSEITKSHGKRSSKALLISAAAAVLSAPTFAQTAPPPNTLPTGGKVVAGTATITQSGATMAINQSSQRGVIDWGSFNVGSAATVNFIQPSSSAATLNRVLDPNPSQIFGRINANGQVFLTNPSGIYFGKSASVNVGALVATTHSIGNEDFMAGNLRFTRNGATGSVINEGSLTADLNGYIALLAPEVRNNGVVIAQGGTVALAAGEVYELEFDNGRMTNLRVEPATIRALVENGNAVQAPGGLIILSAQAADRLQGGVINNTGRLEATGLVDSGGTIRLTASDRISHTGSINVDAEPGKVGAGGTATLIADLANKDSVTEINGSISGRGGDLGGNGGFIETSGGRVRIGSNTRVDTRAPQGKTGMWLLDPADFTIGTDETGASIASSLTTTDRTITAADNLYIYDDIITTADLGAPRNLILKAGLNIYMDNGNTIDATQGGNNQPLTVVLNSATSGGVGNIRITSGSSIKTNGGDIKLGGGTAGDASGYAQGAENTNTWDGYGVALDGVTLDASGNGIGGNISIKGQTGTNNSVGVALGENTLVTIKTNNAGTIDLTGVAGSGSNASYASFRTGLSFWRALLQTGSGAIDLTGTGGNQSDGASDDSGIFISAASWQGSANTSILSSSGLITLTGTKGTGGSGSDIRIGALTKLGTDGTNVTSSTSPIRLVADSIDISETYGGGAPNVSFNTTGQLTVAARTGTSSVSMAAADLPTGIDNSTKKLSWSSNTLSLTTASDLTITAPVTVINAGLDLEPNGGTGNINVGFDTNGISFTGRVDFFQADGTTPRSGTGFLTINGEGYRVITAVSNDPLGCTGCDGAVGANPAFGDQSTLQGARQWMTGASARFALGANVDASATSTWNGGAGFYPLDGFEGKFDGLGHVVSNLNVNWPGNVNWSLSPGLFGTTSGAQIQNIGMTGAAITSQASSVGGLVGRATNGTRIRNSYVSGTVSTGVTSIGGLVGALEDSTISNSYASASVTTGTYAFQGAGGLVGEMSGSSSIDRSHARGTVSGGQSTGGLVGVQSGGTVTNSYYDIDAFGTFGPYGIYSIQLDDWLMGGKAPLNPATYLGAAVNGYYMISSDADIQNLLAFSDNPAYKYQLANSFTMTTSGLYIPSFSGSEFDGAGYTISNLSINLPGKNSLGFFGTVKAGSTVKNLTLANVSVSGYDYVGGLAGYVVAGTTIDNSAVTSGTVSGNNHVGGLVGRNSGTVSASHASADVTAQTYYVGGLVGSNEGAIGTSFATGAVTGNSNVGGLVGMNEATGTIAQSYATGNVSGSASVGGLVGFNDGTVTNSHALATVTSSGDNGGLIGNEGGGSVTNSYYNVNAAGFLSSYGIYSTQFNAWLNGGKVALNPSDYFSLSSGYYMVNNFNDLKNLLPFASNPAYKFAIEPESSIYLDGGFYIPRFAGEFQGNGNTIYHLDLNLPTRDYVGFFGKLASTSVVRGLAFESVTVTGHDYVGALAGSVDAGAQVADTIIQSGSVTGNNQVGGLVGRLDGAVATSSTQTIVTGNYRVGGLVGDTGTGATIDYSYATGSVTGNFRVGGLVGSLAGTITRSYATSVVTGDTNNWGDEIGGLVGYSEGTITKSYATGAVSGAGRVGGLVGYGYGDTIEDSYATGAATGCCYVGGLVGYGYGTTIRRSYASGLVTSINNYYPGGLLGYDYNGASITDSYWDVTTTGQSNSADGGTGLTTTQALQESNYSGFDFTNTWFMVKAGPQAQNDAGTRPMLRAFFAPQVAGTYNIRNLYQLQGMAADLAGNYVLGTNIDASATASTNASDIWVGKGFAPVGKSDAPFTGSLDGQGYSIRHLTINRTSSNNQEGMYIGLFGQTGSTSAISNVHLFNPTITGNKKTGALVGQNGGTISNVVVEDGTISGPEDIGGLVGVNASSGSISGSSVVGVGSVSGISGSQRVGGLVGSNYGTVTNSYASVAVTGDNYSNTGGLVGENLSTGSISGSYATGAVSGRYGVGGLVGASSGAIADSYATGAVSGYGNVGGLAGTNYGTVNNSHATGNVTLNVSIGSYGYSFGGLVGRNGGSLTNTYATGSVSSYGQVGGLVGRNYGGSILGSYATGAISGYESLGGLIGSNEGSVTNSHATGNVTLTISGGNNVGGLVGFNTGSISDTYATGDVTGEDSTGGLVGRNVASNISTTAEILNSYATGVVSGTGRVGGLVGYNLGSNGGTARISGSHATGAVSGTQSIGGLVGSNEGSSGGTARITGSHATGTVTSSTYGEVGGLVGINYGADTSTVTEISNSYATGTVNGSTTNVGGLVGAFVLNNGASGSIADSYASGNVSGQSEVGGLVGNFYSFTGSVSNGSISNSHASGTVTGTGTNTGGLAGRVSGKYGTMSIADSYATGAVSAINNVGGLVGYNEATTQGAVTITNSYATGAVSGTGTLGGLVGQNYGLNNGSATIANSRATGNVTGTGDKVGGLVGSNYGNSNGIVGIARSYATGTVTGGNRVGGLVGDNLGNQTSTATIANSYATGAVTGVDEVGGLVGRNYGNQSATASIDKSLAVNSVTGTTKVGGLVGANVAGSTGGNIGSVSVTSSLYDNSLNGTMTGIGHDGTNASPADVAGQVAGKTPAELGDIATFQAAGWNIAQNNSLTAGALPKLGWQVTDNSAVWVINSVASVINLAFTLSTLGGSYTYQGSPYLLGNLWSSSAIFGNSYSSWVLGTDYTFQYGGNTVTGFTNAATYSNIGISILKSGYQVASNGNTPGLLTINRANATVTGNSSSGTYNGQAQNVSGFTVSGLVNNETASVLSSPAATGATGINAGTYTNTVTGTATDGNYNLSFANGALTINRRPVTVSADAKNKNEGAADPTLTYQTSAQSGSIGLITGESLSGELTRATGETTGSYAIQQGTVNNAGNANYDITYAGADLTINGVPLPPPPPPSPVSPLPPPTSDTPLIGGTPPTGETPPTGGTTPSSGTPSSTSSSSENGASVSSTGSGVAITMVREPSVQQAGVVTVSVPKDMATSGAGFSFPLSATLFEGAANAVIRVTTETGAPLPGWLRFDPQTRVFTASAVPDGAFPMQVIVTVGTQRMTILISERNQ